MMRYGMIMLAAACLAGCEDHSPRKPSFIAATLDGTHDLRRMRTGVKTEAGLSGSFFLFFGDMKASATSEVLVKFAWRMNDGAYAISSMPLERIRVRLDQQASSPTVAFTWSEVPITYRDHGLSEFECEARLDALIDQHVRHAVVTVKESDWPIDINLPLGEP